MDEIVRNWRQRSAPHLWRNPISTRNYPGWDCALDDVARRSMIELCECFLASQWNAKRSITVAPLAKNIAAIPGLDASTAVAPKRLTIHFPHDDVAKEHWHWMGDLNNPILTLGKDKLIELREAFERLASYGDFCIHADDQKLHGYVFEKSSIWFWKWPFS